MPKRKDDEIGSNLKICQICEQSFEQLFTSKTCSPVCLKEKKRRQSYAGYVKRKNNPTLRQKICPLCSSSFLVEFHKDNKFCGTQCAHSQTLLARQREKECAVCSVIFMAKAGNTKICSKECRKILSESLYVDRIVERECRQCTNSYYRVYKRAGFCSVSCGAKFNVIHGISLSPEIIKRQRDTLEKNYGVRNPLLLVKKFGGTSKAQKKLTSELRLKFPD